MSGQRKGRSLLIDDGALPWIVSNASSEASPIRRHIELALCHLAQHGNECVYLSAIFALSSGFRTDMVAACRSECQRFGCSRCTLGTCSNFQGVFS